MDVRAPEREKRESIEVFCCYARKDQSLLLELKAHLTSLQREGLITLWADINIDAGTEWEKEIYLHLNTAHIILLLISSDFMASEYCYSIEMTRAMERHANDEAQVIPIILRPIDWLNTPFGKIQALPTDGKPITGRGWHNIDEALEDVAQGIRKVVDEIRSQKSYTEQIVKLVEVNKTQDRLRSSHVILIDASLDPSRSPYEQTIENGKKVIRGLKRQEGECY